MNKLILLCGIPGSGKSTFAKEYIKDKFNTVIISRDEIRFSLLNDNDEYFSKEKEVFKNFVDSTIKSLNRGENVIADATFLNINSRTKFLRALGKNLKDIEVDIIVFKVPLEVCLERNSKRTGRALVPKTSIINMFNSFSEPTEEEGFNNIIYIK